MSTLVNECRQSNQSEHGTSYLPEVPPTNDTLNDKIDQWRTLVGSSVCLAVLPKIYKNIIYKPEVVRKKISDDWSNIKFQSAKKIFHSKVSHKSQKQLVSNICLVWWFSNNYFCSPDTPRPGQTLHYAARASKIMPRCQLIAWRLLNLYVESNESQTLTHPNKKGYLMIDSLKPILIGRETCFHICSRPIRRSINWTSLIRLPKRLWWING